MTIGNRIRTLRKQLNYSQEYVSEQLVRFIGTRYWIESLKWSGASWRIINYLSID